MTPQAVGVGVDRARPTDGGDMASMINGYAASGLMLPKSPAELHRHFREYVVVRDGGRVVACGGLRVYTPERAEIVAVAVAEHARGRGLGGTVVRALLDEARVLGIREVFALTLEEAFFHRLGFRTVPRSSLPEKVLADCASCPMAETCREIAVLIHLEDAYGGGGLTGCIDGV